MAILISFHLRSHLSTLLMTHLTHASKMECFLNGMLNLKVLYYGKKVLIWPSGFVCPKVEHFEKRMAQQQPKYKTCFFFAVLLYSCDYLPEKHLLTISMQYADYDTTLFVFNIQTKQVLLEINGMDYSNEWFMYTKIICFAH